jgi:hypothetical protein
MSGFPVLKIYPIPIILSVLVCFIFGGLWYGPLFGKFWIKLIGRDGQPPPKTDVLFIGMILSVIGNTLTSFVLTHIIQLWKPSSWGFDNLFDESPIFQGTVVAFMVWAGFSVPIFLNTVAWEGKSWKFFGFQAAYHFFNLQIMALILSFLI